MKSPTMETILLLKDNFLSKETYHKILTKLQTLEYEDSFVSMYGKVIKNKRKVLWVGPCIYEYSQTKLIPRDIPFLKVMCDLLGSNSVLVNYYPDGSAAVNWHSDDEPIFDPTKPIHSMSFGDSRFFEVKEKQTQQVEQIELRPNSLLTMPPYYQKTHLHRVLTSKSKNPRYNLTFRTVHAPQT
jgi:alkylated DNA repair dioxygenase AlkB